MAGTIGLWRRREWGRILCIIIYPIFALSNATVWILTMVALGMESGPVTSFALVDIVLYLLLAVAVIVYLLLPGVRAAFTT